MYLWCVLCCCIQTEWEGWRGGGGEKGRQTEANEQRETEANANWWWSGAWHTNKPVVTFMNSNYGFSFFFDIKGMDLFLASSLLTPPLGAHGSFIYWCAHIYKACWMSLYIVIIKMSGTTKPLTVMCPMSKPATQNGEKFLVKTADTNWSDREWTVHRDEIAKKNFLSSATKCQTRKK